MEPIAVRDFLSFRYVSDPSWSPDGSLAAFVVQTLSEEEERGKGDLYLYEAGSGAVRRLTALGDAKKYCWTADNTLLFPTAREKGDREAAERGEARTVFYEISPHGGEAVRAFALPLSGASLTRLEDGRYLVSARTDAQYPELEGLTGAERDKALEDYAHPAAEVFEEVPFWGNGAGRVSGKRSALFLCGRDGSGLTPITGPLWDASAVYAGRGKIVFLGGKWEGMRPRYSGVYVCDLASGETACVVEPGVMDVGPAALLDEDTLLLAASKGERYGTEEYMQFYTAGLTSGALERLADYEHSIGYGTMGTDARQGGGRAYKLEGGKFWFVSTVGDQTDLMSIDRDGTLVTEFSGGGSVDSFDVRDGRVIFAGFQGQGLTELYDGGGTPLTGFNSAWLAEHSVSVPEFHKFTASDGFEIHGWAMKPAGFREDRKYPAILHIHGGPRVAFGDIYHHEMQVWAGAGYFVFYCNPRGSDGRGNEFGDISGKYGTVDFQNLMEFADEMLRAYPQADPERFGVTGGSYGGFMTNWIIGHTGRFAAACSQRSIASWTCFEHTTDIGVHFTFSQLGTNTRTDMEKLWEQSPLRYAPNAKTPTLFIHSDQDYRCFMAEGLSMFTALKLNGAEARLVLFHGENHDLSRSGRPKNRIRRMEEILRWFDGHLK